MKTITCIVFAVLSYVSVTAQNTLVLCEKYSETGVATGIYSNWTITPTAGYVYLLYNQSRNLSSGLWYLYIDKDWDNTGVFSPYETISLTPDVSKNWTAYDYNFKEAGDYKAYIMFNGEQMASTSFNIAMDAGVSGSNSDAITTYYYENSNVLFCESVNSSGDPTGVKSIFTRTGGSVTTTVYMTNSEKAFKTDLIYADVYKTGTEDMYDSYNFTIEPDWDWIKFNYTFTEPGEYVIDLYTSDDIFINSSPTVTIK